MIEVGSYVFSRTRFHADDDITPLGGVVIDGWDDGEDHLTASWKVVESWRGKVLYHVFDVDDTVTGQSAGQVRADVVRDLLLQLAVDETRRRDPLAHMTARNVLAGVLSRHSVTRAAR